MGVADDGAGRDGAGLATGPRQSARGLGFETSQAQEVDASGLVACNTDRCGSHGWRRPVHPHERGGVRTLTGANPGYAADTALRRDDIWFATSDTVTNLPEDIDHVKLPQALRDLKPGQFVVWIRGEQSGVVIADWEKWDESNRLVVCNHFEGAFAITKAGVAQLLRIMVRYVDVEESVQPVASRPGLPGRSRTVIWPTPY